MLRGEFSNTFRELSHLGYALVFIAHSKSRETKFKDEAGNKIMQAFPDMTNAAFGVVSKLVDIVAYIDVNFTANGESERYLYFRSTPHHYAKSRYKYITTEPVVLGYKELTKAVVDAIEKEVELDGAISSEDSNDYYGGEEAARPFSDVMQEAKTLWQKLIEKNESNLEAMQTIIQKNFGREVKLATATEQQQDIVELVVDEFKGLLKQ